MCFTPLDATLPDLPNGFGRYCSEYVLDAKIPAFRHRISLDRFSSANWPTPSNSSEQQPNAHLSHSAKCQYFRPFFYLKSVLAAPKKAQMKDILVKQVNNLQSKTQNATCKEASLGEDSRFMLQRGSSNPVNYQV